MASRSTFLLMSQTAEEKIEYVNLSALKRRGWTPSLVKNFLGKPDATRENPFYRSAAPQKLYLLSRVEGAQANAEFQEKKQISARRSQAAQARAAKARQALIAEVMSKVRVRQMPFDQLRRKALASKAEYDRYRDDYTGDYESAAEQHIHRWMVNYARHNLSNYDSVRDRYHGKVGVQDAAEVVRDAVLDRIAELWPELKQACIQARRQIPEY